ncbi:MAG: hypothetical protein Q9210_006999 [Variospora velana]
MLCALANGLNPEKAEDQATRQANDLATLSSALRSSGMNDTGSYIKPIPERYEGQVVNCAAVLNQDLKKSALQITALRSSAQNLNVLLEHRNCVDARNSKGDTPLHVAASVGRSTRMLSLCLFGKERKDIYGLLVANRARLSVENRDALTPAELNGTVVMACGPRQERRVKLILSDFKNQSIEFHTHSRKDYYSREACPYTNKG